MLVSKTSNLTGIKRTKDIPVTSEQMAFYLSGALIQEAFPDLNGSDREFILTGITDEEWEELFMEE